MAYTVKINQKELDRLYEAIDTSLNQMARTAAQIMIEKQVIPKETGALEKSQGVKRLSRNEVQLYYDVPYARRVYYLPAKQIHKRKKKGNKKDRWNDNRNLHARPRWVEAVFAEEDMTALFAYKIKQNLGLRDFGDTPFRKPKEKSSTTTTTYANERWEGTKEVVAKVKPAGPARTKSSGMSASEFKALYEKNRSKR